MSNHKMTNKQHKERHILLHTHLDELAADFIAHTKKTPGQATIIELMEWSSHQTKHPDHQVTWE